MQPKEIVDWLYKLDEVEAKSLLFGLINALQQGNYYELDSMRKLINQMIIDDSTENITRIY